MVVLKIHRAGFRSKSVGSTVGSTIDEIFSLSNLYLLLKERKEPGRHNVGMHAMPIQRNPAV